MASSVGLPQRRKATVALSYPAPQQKRGPGGKDAKDLGPALRGRSPSAAVPRPVFGSFLQGQKGPRRQAKPDGGKPGTAFPAGFWRCQKKWCLKIASPRRSLWQSLKKVKGISLCSRPPPAPATAVGTSPAPAGRRGAQGCPKCAFPGLRPGYPGATRPAAPG